MKMDIKIVLACVILVICTSKTDAACDTAALTTAGTESAKCVAIIPTDASASDYCTKYKKFFTCYKTALGTDCASNAAFSSSLSTYQSAVDKCGACSVAVQISVLLACLLGAFVKNM